MQPIIEWKQPKNFAVPCAFLFFLCASASNAVDLLSASSLLTVVAL
jgi:hypothetical protein